MYWVCIINKIVSGCFWSLMFPVYLLGRSIWEIMGEFAGFFLRFSNSENQLSAFFQIIFL